MDNFHTYGSHQSNKWWISAHDCRKILYSMCLFLQTTRCHSRGAYSSAWNYCMLFNDPNSHRTVESLVTTCSENGRCLFQANSDSQFYGKFRGLWTKEYFWQTWNQSLRKVWETTMNTQRRCGRMSKITENWLNTAVFGHMEHYNRSNVAPTESYKMSEHNIFLLQLFEHQPICKPTYKTGYRRSA